MTIRTDEAATIAQALACGRQGCRCARQNGTGFQTHCPVSGHDDKRPSFSVRQGDERVLFRCHVGCSQEDVMDALRERGLWGRQDGHHEGEGILAVYDYLDENGRLWGQVVRKPDHDFRVRQPDKDGGWEWTWRGVTRRLYRLPELLAADPTAWVFVVEGEKDADRLAGLGLTATTNPHGAGKWRPEYSATLKGRKVAIIPDHDTPGMEHAQQVAQSLAGVATDVRIVELPAQEIRDDVSDWLDRGGTAEALLVKVEAAEILSPAPYIEREKEKFITARDLVSQSPAEVPWLAKPWVAVGASTMVSGKPKLAGKTTFTLHLVKAILDGGTFLGETVEQSPVVYLTEERKPTFVGALRRVGLEDSQSLMIRQYNPGDAWADVVRETLAEAERIGARLIVVDTLPQFAGIKADGENAAGNARDALEPFARIEDIAVVVDFHDRKAGGDPGEATRGSNQFAGAVDIIIGLQRLPNEGHERRREVRAVGRFDEVPDRVIIELRDDGYALLGDGATVSLDDAKAAIRDALAGDKHLTEDELWDELKGGSFKKTTMGQSLRGLVEDGEVRREGGGKKKSPYRYFLSPHATHNSPGGTTFNAG